VDLHLESGVRESYVDRWVHSACLLCSNGCGCDIAVKDGRMVGVRGRATDVVNHGRLRPKGLYGSTPWASSPDRLTQPLVREGGRLVETDWDTGWAGSSRSPSVCWPRRARSRTGRAHSVTLAGFGLDSLIEIGASVVVLWELSDSGKKRRAEPCA